MYKYDKHSRLTKYKARLVVRRDQQKDTNKDIYTATLAKRSFRILIVIVARFDLELLQYNVVNAFVYIDLKEKIYMKILLRYRRFRTILQLNKALYSLRKSLLL